MQEKQLVLVTYEQAKKLKEMGFDWKTRYRFYHYENEIHCGKGEEENYNQNFEYRYTSIECSAPTVALALKWFRDVKGKFNFVVPDFEYEKTLKFNYVVLGADTRIIGNKHFNTYEEAESALLDALLEHCEQEVKNA